MRTFSLLMTLLMLILLFFSHTILTEDTNEEEFEDDDFGEYHCVLGLIGIILVVFVIGSGFLTSGRFGRIRFLKPLPLHRINTVIMAFFFTGEAVYGFISLQWLFIPNIHGYLGILIPALAWLNISISPCVTKKIITWKTASRLHALLGVVLFLFVLLQVWYAYTYMEI